MVLPCSAQHSMEDEMIALATYSIILTPVFFVLVRRYRVSTMKEERRTRRRSCSCSTSTTILCWVAPVVVLVQ